MILGIDEVGRGPWAGPMVVGAVVLGTEIDGLTDSKKLSKKRREALNDEILSKAAAIGLGWVSATEIDELGLSQALRLATSRAVREVQARDVAFHEIIIDGTINLLADTALAEHVTTMKKADLLVPSVSAASIVAKVARDRYMDEQDVVYPGYGFKKHVGYGTAAHREAIDSLGVTSLHRLSFAPLMKYNTGAHDRTAAKENDSPSIGVSTRSIGDSSEEVAARELERRGHAILDRNWKTKWCEIDIVSSFRDTIYFTEVKHRRNDAAGGGFDAITDTKLRQMKFAATLYVQKNRLTDINLRLMAISTTSDNPHVVDVLKI